MTLLVNPTKIITDNTSYEDTCKNSHRKPGVHMCKDNSSVDSHFNDPEFHRPTNRNPLIGSKGFINLIKCKGNRHMFLKSNKM